MPQTSPSKSNSSSDEDYESESEDSEESYYEEESDAETTGEEESAGDEQYVDEDESSIEEDLDENDIPHLLSLAAEHDRVDILQSVLEDVPKDKISDVLNNNNGTIPPLHIAISFGSINAVNCLLRMGANPCIRPQIVKGEDSFRKFDKLNAYQLIQKLNLGDKKEMVETAFFMESLRALNGGEVERVVELLESGVKVEGDNGLLNWAQDMEKDKEGSTNGCLEVIRRYAIEEHHEIEGEIEDEKSQGISNPICNVKHTKTVVEEERDRLLRKLEENEELSLELCISLEDLKGEVSICQSLLLGGHKALISYVKNMKAQKAQKEVEFDQYRNLWEQQERDVLDLQMACGECPLPDASSTAQCSMVSYAQQDDEVLKQKLEYTQARVSLSLIFCTAA